MFNLEILVREFLAVDRLPTCAVAGGEVPALDHELLDYAVEGGAGVGEGFAGFADAFVACAEGAEVRGCEGDDGVVEGEDYAAGGLGADGDVEVDEWARHGCGLGGLESRWKVGRLTEVR